MFHKKTLLSWMSIAAVAALVIAACSPAAAPSTPEGTAVIPNTGATSEATPAAGGGGNATIIVSTNSSLGQILTDAKGKTLYVYTQDTPGVSKCSDNCANLWPPLTVNQGETPVAGPGVSGTLGTLTRPDGTLQVTVNNLPVYYWSKDTNMGDATGQGVGGFWFVLDAGGNPVKGTPAAPAATSAVPASTSAAPADTSATPPAIPATYP